MPDENLHSTEAARSDDDTIVAGKDAREGERDNPAGEAVPGQPATEVLTLVCETCGKDYFFEDETPEAGMTCVKCGGSVFRSFHTTVGDEASDDFRDSTERDLDTDDPEGDVLPGDILDLNRL